MKNWIIVIVTILIIGGVYFAGFKHGESTVKVQYLEKEKLIYDTITVIQQVIKNTPAKIDSSVVTLIDDSGMTPPQLVKTKVASSDTLVIKDSSRIRIKYFFPPINKFDVWAEIRQKTIYRPEIKLIEKPTTIWDRFGSGVQIGLGYGAFSKKIDVYIGFGFHFKIN